MELSELKKQLQQAHLETEEAFNDYAKQSAVHRAALQLIQFEKELFYGDTSVGHHLKRIKEIIEANADEIEYEAN